MASQCAYNLHSLVTRGDEQTSMCLFSTRIFSLANYLFKLFAHLKKFGFFSFRYVVRAFSSKYESSVGYMVCRYFPQFAACLFTQGLLQSNHFSFLMKSSLTMFSFLDCAFLHHICLLFTGPDITAMCFSAFF